MLEGVCYQTREIFDAMSSDSGVKLSSLLVDGGMTSSSLMLQLQADILGVEVAKPAFTEVRIAKNVFITRKSANVYYFR